MCSNYCGCVKDLPTLGDFEQQGWTYWHTSLIPVLGRLKQEGSWVRGHPGLPRETQPQNEESPHYSSYNIDRLSEDSLIVPFALAKMSQRLKTNHPGSSSFSPHLLCSLHSVLCGFEKPDFCTSLITPKVQFWERGFGRDWEEERKGGRGGKKKHKDEEKEETEYTRAARADI